MEVYDPNHICNGSDDNGRYTYIAQVLLPLVAAHVIARDLPLEPAQAC